MAGKIEIFTVYQHDRLNETGYVVVTGDEGAPSSDTTRPFGSIYVFRDDLTLHNDSDSPVAGVMEGTATTTNFDGLHNLLAAKISLHHRGYRGSVSVLGGSHDVGVSGGRAALASRRRPKPPPPAPVPWRAEHRESALGRALVLSHLVVGRPVQVLRHIGALLHHLFVVVVRAREGGLVDARNTITNL
ncbi:unnamed protein product [Miscanthus lutarioriparius]|uniref:Dirigent protein n=1 Tax=Miscanthus lutarioriparius TaxID=422564 RepID=A0A811P2X8_9POAL|nr:unnamed protein product [Miscanthus lutarioriparius]